MSTEKNIHILLREFRHVSKRELEELAEFNFAEASLVLATRLHARGEPADSELSQAFAEASEADILAAAQTAASEYGVAI